MKKFTVLAVLALMVAVVMPVMATDFTWSGELTYGAINDFTNTLDGYANVTFTGSGKVDASNTVNMSISTGYANAGQVVMTDISGTTGTISAFTAYLSTFDIVTDVAKALGLNGFNFVTTFGWADMTATSYNVSAYGNESLVAYDPAARDNVGFVAGLGAPFSLMVSFAPFTNSGKVIAFEPLVLVDAYGVVGPLSYSAVYYTTHSGTDKGKAGASVTFGQAFGDITPSINVEGVYDLNAPATKVITYGVGAKFAYKSMVTVGAGLDGWDSPGLDALTVNASLVPMASLGIDLGAKFDLSGATSPNYGVDISAWYLLGKAKARLGYLITNNAYGSLNAPASLTDGGLYLTMDIVL